MASYKDDDGNWMYSYEEIASRLHMDPRTVSQCVREGCRRGGQRFLSCTFEREQFSPT